MIFNIKNKFYNAESKIKILSFFYLLIIFSLFLYSYTQVDLGLTLSRLSTWQIIQKSFQSIGYFNRPLSAFFYLIIVLLLFTFYLIFLTLTYKKRIDKKQLWTIIGITTIILTFSYNAFSYDLFNYIFDAKIFTFYGQNPYLFKPLDFPKDPMLSFMHWTHRVYPYGPTWLLSTIPISYLGMQYFLLTLFLFKIFISAGFLGTTFFIGKILRKISPENELFGLTLFALNPLVIIECLVSAHNDIWMLFLAVYGIYLLLSKKYNLAFLILLLSIGVKFATITLLPIFILILICQVRKKSIPWDKILILSTVFMLIAVIFASLRTNFQSWYLLYALPFAAILGKKYYILIPIIIISFFALLEYIPFLYLGNWNSPVPLILFWLTTGSIILSAFFTGIYFLKHNFVRNK